MEPTLQVPHIIASASVPLTFNTTQINGLYTIHQTLLDLLGASRIEALKIKFESKQPLDGPEISFICITQLIDRIYKSATANNMTEMKSLDKSVAAAIQSQTAS